MWTEERCPEITRLRRHCRPSQKRKTPSLLPALPVLQSRRLPWLPQLRQGLALALARLCLVLPALWALRLQGLSLDRASLALQLQLAVPGMRRTILRGDSSMLRRCRQC